MTDPATMATGQTYNCMHIKSRWRVGDRTAPSSVSASVGQSWSRTSTFVGLSSNSSSQMVFPSTSRATASTGVWCNAHSARRQSVSFLAMKLPCGAPEEQRKAMYEARSNVVGRFLPILPCGRGCRVVAIVFACLPGRAGQRRGRAVQPVEAPVRAAHAGGG
jgi:hypothetical protein